MKIPYSWEWMILALAQNYHNDLYQYFISLLEHLF